MQSLNITNFFEDMYKNWNTDSVRENDYCYMFSYKSEKFNGSAENEGIDEIEYQIEKEFTLEDTINVKCILLSQDDWGLLEFHEEVRQLNTTNFKAMLKDFVEERINIINTKIVDLWGIEP